MVVSKQHYVEARYISSNLKRSMLNISSYAARRVLPRMKQAHKQIGAFLFFDYRHPFACTLHHVVEAKSFPQVLGKRSRDGGRNQAQHRNFHAIALDDGVRR